MRLTRAIAVGLVAVAGCNGDHAIGRVRLPDLAAVVMGDDLGQSAAGDGGVPDQDPCGISPPDPECFGFTVGPPQKSFPLQADRDHDPLEQDDGVSRDAHGYLHLDSSHSGFQTIWIANAADNESAGTLSKLDSSSVREVARYDTVTCYSLPGGSTEACDGTRGCCSVDDWARYQARQAGGPQPGHQSVQRNANDPSRTSVDLNGDVFVSNRAFVGQSSVTKVANDPSSCIDRNRNGRIDTSSDSNGDGFIEEDCNEDFVPDDIASVLARPCVNSLPQEFYGPDDECILWTSNTFVSGAIGRPLGLSASGDDAVLSDVWAGSFNLGRFVRIDGATGLDKDDLLLPSECYEGESKPYGLAVDSQGIAWVAALSAGKLCYFDTRDSTRTGSVRDPTWGPMSSYGITMDRDQNVWIGMEVARYTPDRSHGFDNLGGGWWTRVLVDNSTGIAADSRSRSAYFVYACAIGVVQIPASTIKVTHFDQQIRPNNWPVIKMPCYGVGVDADQNVWGVAGLSSALGPLNTATRARVDALGDITQPVVAGPAAGDNVCPAGDSCFNAGAYTYSDFTGFGYRNFTRPRGSYRMIVKGCTDKSGAFRDTQWWQLGWDADLPPNTSLIVHAKSGTSLDPDDPSWQQNAFTTDQSQSPINLQRALTPNLTPSSVTPVVNDPFLLLEFLLESHSRGATPTLKSFAVGFKCGVIG